jgi:hypothetical protein
VKSDRTATEFEACREDLERAVAAACSGEGSWPSAVVAGIHAALELAAADPESALLLTEGGVGRVNGSEPRFNAMVDRFAALLARDAPPANPRLPGPRGVVLCIVKQVNLRIRSGRAGEMMEIAPDLAFLALLPFVGFAGAQRWSQPTAVA